MTSLVEELRSRYQDVVDAELARLARRAPQLGDADLQAIRESTHAMVERMERMLRLLEPDHHRQADPTDGTEC